ncbi:MAG: SDR family NAD(P)-dependent oxidoreductase [Rhodospirillaceae bacterium]|jgi:short-subunit dehydrogenase|nr:SDR family NAD(P)-dependent oxidoreductase [Rhodospirillaceae bacterium]MBT5244333.1 SDR family NAD(P)-dependent oxidoreductase [Rhodospirillaceae bacterium]MBT5563694.1 SDR family NAD(P)-dependent oxidoreductase [Rhodospirillaceae bacterium]MBT6241524.1 SDR family NAD(P)-dependent oxidoreductase [Rhodospirillaceae bacterium]MBT7137060.1 SDR family NAD(P)-dependent oxidoreductase [Rhodospirillaceae bacterium]
MSKDGILSGHSALIAGGSSGIGLACARLLAANDCQLHLAARDDEALDQACESIVEDYGIEVEALPTDLSEPVNAAALALDCEDVDILINAFGSVPRGTIETLQGEDWQTGFELRVFGAISLTREVYEGMLELGTGIIINIGGAVGEDDEDGLCILSANAALKAFCENLDKQAKREGVRVLPYFPETDIGNDDHAATLIQLIFGKLSS